VLIIAGHLTVPVEARDAYVATCRTVVEAARGAQGCLDFSITADTLDRGQVRIFERWASEDELLAFRGSGPADTQQAAILSADVKRYAISAVTDP
jgi:quinol monooxygenase YgiN